jgi:hypothetical protein
MKHETNAKQYPVKTGMQLGNFSQASSDFSMIGTALNFCRPDQQQASSPRAASNRISMSGICRRMLDRPTSNPRRLLERSARARVPKDIVGL